MIKPRLFFIKHRVNLVKNSQQWIQYDRARERRKIIAAVRAAWKKTPWTVVQGLLMRSCSRVRLNALRCRARSLCFDEWAIFCVELHPMLSTSLRLGELRFGKCYEWYARWPDLAVIGKLSRAFVTSTRYRSASAPVTDEVNNYFHCVFIFATSDKIQQIQHWPRTHPDLG